MEDAVGEDIDKLVLHCRELSDTDKSVLKVLYEQYDAQDGFITHEQHDNLVSYKAEAIKGQYEKTYKGKVHYYLRDSLMKDVYKCPYCSINQPSTLDHYMPKSDYPALSMCRLNLVPMCPECNRKKNDYPYGDFIHSYYQSFPDCIFLKATADIQGRRIIINFYLDEASISDAALLTKLKNQIKRIDLLGRLNRESTSFVEDLCAQWDYSLNIGFRSWLTLRCSYYERTYGLNDWRTAAIAAILDNKDIDYTHFNIVAKNTETQL